MFHSGTRMIAKGLASGSRREGESGQACAACGALARTGGGCAAAPDGAMVVPWQHRATTSPAQGTSEGEAGFRAACGSPPNASAWMRWPEERSRKRSRVSDDMAVDTLSAPRLQGFPHHDKDIEPCPRDLAKHPG
jgi:hypothetical protein